ncbi:alpha/beta hydrolase [Pseudomonas lopnurensis]|uniref:alpha/beta hydrolase n=1 Tax=Pseudomonas lopnurensis TaxID=1477517 RepID=UPI00187AD892|nr:alpha/beta hydrolase [Pseudomonas lopnurensis]MBE7375560.1 alpha/beta hydrolase [Pseudomonas lopnurensis]
MRFLPILLLLIMSIPFAQAQTLLNQTLNLDTGHGVLQGSLLLPKSDRPLPVALLIAGSGPTDRDGNNPGGRNDSLKRLAQGLAKRGVASLRYDKRGVGASLAAAPDERDLSVEAYADDALAWSAKLRSDPRFAELILIGHSEGALIASLAAPRSEATALIAIAGSGRPIDEVLREQLQGRLPPALLASSHYLIDELKAGRTHAQVPEPLQVLFRPSVQPYLISLFAQDPAAAFAAVGIPALIVQGRTDIQIGIEDARALARAKPDARLALIDGMNHVLRIVPADDRQLASYDDPERPIAHALLERIAEFLQDNGILPASS